MKHVLPLVIVCLVTTAGYAEKWKQVEYKEWQIFTPSKVAEHNKIKADTEEFVQKRSEAIEDLLGFVPEWATPGPFTIEHWTATPLDEALAKAKAMKRGKVNGRLVKHDHAIGFKSDKGRYRYVYRSAKDKRLFVKQLPKRIAEIKAFHELKKAD